jgi:ATP-dependent protease Clp ATPase subunit
MEPKLIYYSPTLKTNSIMSTQVIGQDKLVKEMNKVFSIFKTSEGEIRPHFVLTGSSGSGKNFTINQIAEMNDLHCFEINAAQLTKEGTSGNSLSKALSPLLQNGNRPTIVFVDEFDKLFISGNSNSSHAHETTNGVQNEFLKVLEADETAVFGDYGKYVNVSVKNVLFVFAGAFNGEENISLDRLRELGLKTEFLGRVGLVYNTNELTLENMFTILDQSPLLKKYISLFEDVDAETVTFMLKSIIQKNYENNTLGARMINTLINQYFIKGGDMGDDDTEQVTFQNKLKLD